ncbi:MAG: alpha/beta hydrolase [Gammaproteobacteria bacterium]|nr:MAG: alpha/beta hydrolase [Gammaproteobacteria bacterium]
MFKKLAIIVLLTGLFSCTATLKEETFIAQSEKVTLYDQEMLANWQQQFPQHKLNPLSFITADKSAQLQGLYLDNNHSNDLLFVIQGNGMQIKDGGIAMLHSLASLPVDIVIFDRRGLGASSGQATISNLISDASEQYQFIQATLNADKIIIHGYSLGSFIATQLAKQQVVDALVLQGSATNVDDWVEAKTPWYVSPFLTVNIDPAFKIADNQSIVAKDYHKPLLIIAGENDQQVPVELSKQLYNASQSPNKTLLVVKGANHGGMFDNPTTASAYLKFLMSL